MIRSQLLSLGLSLCLSQLSAQFIILDAVPAAGAYHEDQATGFTQHFLTGEPRTGTREASGYTLIEGFLQPWLFSAISDQDSVWPGDTNDDGIANMFDLFPIGIGYGSSGSLRPNASLNWTGQPASPWTSILASGTNFKHIDADGSGLINDDDTLGIILNYGLSHNKTEEMRGAGIPLIIEFLEDSLTAGDTAHVLIQFGVDTLPAQEVYGLAFSMNLDTSKVDPASFQPDFSSSWLGTDQVDMLSLAYYHLKNQSIDIGLVRTNHQHVNGYGPIASFSIIMIDDLAGKRGLDEILSIEATQAQAISVNEDIIDVNAVFAKDSLLLQEVNTSLDDKWLDQILVYPNPATRVFEVHMGSLRGHSLNLYDMYGRSVYSLQAPFQKTQVLVEQLSAGTYLLLIETKQGVFRRRIMLDSPGN